MTRREKAETINARAIEREESGHLKQAIELYREASAVDPLWPAPLYNLGLLFKNQRRWRKSFTYNRRATALDPKDEAAWWNLGIAATALGRWKTARRAWRGFGINVPRGDGPIDFPCGFGPIRLHPTGDAEIVWAHRIDPARAVIASVPFPESNYRWKDVVLNDGAPIGYRQYQGEEVPVLDALQLLETSPFGTYIARVALPPGRDLDEQLAEVAARLGGSAENWSTSIRIICKACSEGRPHDFHDPEAPADGIHLVGIAAEGRGHAREILSAWKSGAKGIRMKSFEEALPPGPPGD
jgi:hypothetical protein